MGTTTLKWSFRTFFHVKIPMQLMNFPKSPFFTMWTSYRIETKSKMEESSSSHSPAVVESYAVWNKEKSSYEFSKGKFNADLEERYIETAIERSQKNF